LIQRLTRKEEKIRKENARNSKCLYHVLLVTLTIEKMHTFEISWKIPNSDSLLQSKFNCYIPIKPHDPMQISETVI